MFNVLGLLKNNKKNKSVESFVYSVGGCGMPKLDKLTDTPHSADMEYRPRTEQCDITKHERCEFVIPEFENFHISTEESTKHFR